MGSLGKKLRRKKFHKQKKKLIREYQKLSPEQQDAKRDLTNAMLNVIDDRIERGKLKPADRLVSRKPPTPEDVMNTIDLLKEVDSDEKDRKVDTD